MFINFWCPSRDRLQASSKICGLFYFRYYSDCCRTVPNRCYYIADFSIATLFCIEILKLLLATAASCLSRPRHLHSLSHSQLQSIFSFLQQTSASFYILREPECKEYVLGSAFNTSRMDLKAARVEKVIFGGRRFIVRGRRFHSTQKGKRLF